VQENANQHDEMRRIVFAVFSLILNVAVDGKPENSCKE